ncbi:hypothetical protein [Sphingomonas solaris]|uniref:Uncharacterized protein n=1 Tax=Alterirhizorhabdus solaris TaxID=2529389 RepID=A0A558R1X4_9SPHN|nr:hypothetical protein [Sphingomonas solaris]TVV73342.1 hypothetical protein FOY91_12435 [Sphingomonas solaris]
MTLAIETAVRGVAEVLRDRVAPTLDDGYAIEAVRLSAMMLTMMANAADDAVVLRVAENGQLRALFGEAAGIVDDATLSARLEEAARSSDPGLRISELDRETDRLRRLLVALQIQLEAQADEQATILGQRIWRMLRDIEASRAPRR